MKTVKKITSVILSASLLVLSSCANAAESVQNKTKTTSESTASQECAVSDDLDLDIPRQVKTGEYICMDGFEDKYKELFPHYCKDFDESKMVQEDNTYPTGPSYTDTEQNISVAVGCTGFFSYFKAFDEQKYFNESEFVKAFTYSEAAKSSEKYKLVGSENECSVSEALKLAEDFAQDFKRTCDYPNDFSVSRISLHKCADGYFYTADYTQLVSGVKILEYPCTYDAPYENLVLAGSYAYICGDEVNAFVVNSCFEEYDIKGELTSVCDPVSAFENVSGTLASNMKLTVKRAALEYCMVRTGNVQEAEGKESDREKSGGATYCSYDIYKAVPCWVFYFDEANGNEIYAILDCEDMSVSFVNNQK